MHRVIDAAHAEHGYVSAQAIAEESGLSSVSARRYLRQLVERGDASTAIRYGKTGRPTTLYKWEGAGSLTSTVRDERPNGSPDLRRDQDEQ